MDERDCVRLRGVVRRHAHGGAHVEALRGIDLDVPTGEYLGIFGPSGSGKSTLLNVIGGLDRADGGTVVVLDQDFRLRSDDQRAIFRRRSIGIVLQAFDLLASLTVLENVALPLLLDGSSSQRAQMRARAMLDAVGLEDRSSHRPDQLSGGEMQRAAIARALVGEPRLLLADEPTGNLDSVQGQAIWGLFKDLAAKRGRTVIVVTHDPRAAGWCSRVIELRDGRIVPSQREAPAARTAGGH
jgi:putative ABC transport system ATP-binding protein